MEKKRSHLDLRIYAFVGVGLPIQMNGKAWNNGNGPVIIYVKASEAVFFIFCILDNSTGNSSCQVKAPVKPRV